MNFLQKLIYKPYTATLHITSKNGFHLRPAARFSSEAKRFNAEIAVHFGNQVANAKAVNSLLSLGLDKEDRFTLHIRGKDAQKALETLEILFNHLMQEDQELETIQKTNHHYGGTTIEGEIISEGITAANAFYYREEEKRSKTGIAFSQAISNSLETLETLYQIHKEEKNAEIYLAQKILLDTISSQVDSFERFEKAIGEASSRLTGTKMEAKAIDYKDVLHRVKNEMGIETEMFLPETPSILMAEELLPSQIEQLTQNHYIEGVILKKTTLTSHTAILLRAAGIPSLIADYSNVQENTHIILDAHSGVIVTLPSGEDLQSAQKRKTKDLEQRNIAAERRFEKAVTRNKKQIRVLANVTDVHSAQTAKEEGAEGIGLLRTEFLFKEKKPTIEAQTSAYREIFTLFDEVTIRTLDVGGDKKLPYLTLPEEENPFLGIRGIRLFKTHPSIMEEQLHAIFLAAQGRSVKVMFPMVSSMQEFTDARIFAEQTAQKYALDITSVQFGIMIEVPSILFLIREFNPIVDFYSIGTNDLIQYLFAIERTHPSLKVDTHSPVIYDAIKTIVEQAEKPVSICGELASNTQAVPKLLRTGIETLSISPKYIAAIKEEIRHV